MAQGTRKSVLSLFLAFRVLPVGGMNGDLQHWWALGFLLLPASVSCLYKMPSGDACGGIERLCMAVARVPYPFPAPFSVPI